MEEDGTRAIGDAREVEHLVLLDNQIKVREDEFGLVVFKRDAILMRKGNKLTGLQIVHRSSCQKLFVQGFLAKLTCARINRP